LLFRRLRREKFSFKLIEKILSLKRQIVFTSELVLAEVFSVIHDDAINICSARRFPHLLGTGHPFGIRRF
jgi:hypothetical protein